MTLLKGGREAFQGLPPSLVLRRGNDSLGETGLLKFS
jgi:hypothetical protein